MSELSRETLLNIIETDHVQCGEASALARMALAAIDSEPVGEFYEDGPLNWYQISDGDRVPAHRRIPLYRHAQQPVVPATLPCSVELKPGLIIGKGCKTETLLTALRRRADYNADIDAMTPEERAEYDASIEAFKAMLPQPAPVVPDERDKAVDADDHPLLWSFNAGWNACRAAMLQAGNSPVIPGAEQRIADAVGLLKQAAPAMLADNSGPNGPLAGRMKSPVIPDGWQVEAEKLTEMHGMSFVLFRHGEAPQCADPTKVVISFTDKGLGHDTLPAAPAGIPTISDTWIPVSERMPEKGQSVLVYRPKAHEGGDPDVRVSVYGRHNYEHGFGCYWEPSHWMPLPAAPQEVPDGQR
ncbi:hypothetical protein BME18_12525 [Klebsiella michiganensis]|nr:hypothetical protein BME18_12525 [Klebsiella michiganensis]